MAKVDRYGRQHNVHSFVRQTMDGVSEVSLKVLVHVDHARVAFSHTVLDEHLHALPLKVSFCIAQLGPLKGLIEPLPNTEPLCPLQSSYGTET